MKSLDLGDAGISPRCAIYTRKSFQPPLAQEISSLESQRSICSSLYSEPAAQGLDRACKAVRGQRAFRSKP